MMAEQRNRPILVTGAHRSGTTWVGKMLAAAPQTAYISEPLNVLHRRGVLDAPVETWYTCIGDENEADFIAAYEKMLALKYGLGAELVTIRSRKDFLRMVRDFAIFWRGRVTKARPLIKDPFAVFSLDWFTRRLGCRVVVTVRHPAAFAGSLKRLNWPFDFSDLLAQPLLMRTWLEPYREAMTAMQKTPHDILGQAALLWKMIYSVVWQEQKRLPELTVVKHEDLSRDPAGGFRNLYQAVGLTFTPQVEQTVLRSSSTENPAELSRSNVHAVRLDSRSNIQNWKKRLTQAEIERIRCETEETAAAYYSAADW